MLEVSWELGEVRCCRLGLEGCREDQPWGCTEVWRWTTELELLKTTTLATCPS